MLFCTIYSFLFDWNREFIKRGILVEFIAVTKFNVFMELSVMAFLFMLQRGADVSRLVMGYFVILNIFIVWLVRLAMKKALRVWFTAKSNIVKIMIITKDAALEKTLSKLREAMDINYEIVALACVDKDRKGETVEGVEINANRENVLSLARQMPLDEVFISLPDEDMSYVKHIIYDLESMGVACHYNIDIIERPSKEVRVGSFAGFTVVTYSINHFDYRRMVVKRMIDIVGGLVGCLITVAVTPFVAVAIKLDSPGPVLFAQTRIGKTAAVLRFISSAPCISTRRRERKSWKC